MASSVATMAVAGTVVPLRNASGLSSSASFGSSVVNAAPLRPAAKRNVMVTRAALPQEASGKTARREMLASLIAAGAALATVGSSMAASGPGTSGAEATSEKVNDLTKKADELTSEQSPPRFGTPGEDDSGRIAQKGGAGAIQDLQGGTTDSIDAAKANVEKAKKGFNDLFGKKTGDLSDASDVLKDLTKGKVDSDLATTKGKVDSDIETTKGKVKSLSADAQSNIDSSSGDAGSFFGGLVDKLQEAVPQ